MRYTFVSAALVFATLSLCQSAWSQPADYPSRSWHDRQGQLVGEAVFVGYDYDSQLVQLRAGDDQLIEISVKRLAPKDRRYLLKVLREINPQPLPPRRTAKRKTSKLQSGGSADVVDHGTSPGRAARGKMLYGIRWQASVDQALLAGRGSETSDDDRPVMWFRVLGDLEGFM